MPSAKELLAAAVLATGGLGVVQDRGPESMPPTLTVTGDAEVSSKPDRAVVELGATAQAPQASAAQRQVNEAMQRAVAAIVETGVARQSIRTTGISLQPVYSQPQRDQQQVEEYVPRIVAYRASNTVRILVDEPSAIGGVIDAGIAAGANQLESIAFELRDDTPQRLDALRAATRTARQKAEALAEAAGVQLLSVQAVREGGGQIVSPMQTRARAMSFEAGTPVEPGEVRVSASVSLEYRIAPVGSGGGGQR